MLVCWINKPEKVPADHYSSAGTRWFAIRPKGGFFGLIQNHFHRAINARVIAQGGQSEGDVTAGVEHVLGEVGTDAVQQDRTGVADAAADDDDLGINDAADASQEHAQVVIDPIHDAQGGLVPGFGVVENVSAVMTSRSRRGEGVS